MPLPHRDPAITAYVRHVVIGLDNTEPTKIAARLGVSGAWVVNVRDGHRGVGLDALRKIAAAHFGGSLDRLEQAARDWAAEREIAERQAGERHGTAHRETPESTDQPASPKHRAGTKATKSKPRRAAASAEGPPGPARSGSMPLDNLRAARERLLERGYPRDAINEALLSPAVQDSSDVLLVFDLAERQLIASGYAGQMQNLLRRGRETAARGAASRAGNVSRAEAPSTPAASARPSGQKGIPGGTLPSPPSEPGDGTRRAHKSPERPARTSRRGRS